MNNLPLNEGVDFYYDEHGYVVFTEQYHLNKGYCCGHGCRHCPYDYESVPEPRRSQLLDQKRSTSTPKA
ncbi:MAG: hypothetical protein GXC72_02355 [Chitinophagaceae bacterium]|nr:hypothetical protein [Chitinophagaceae bacterium]